jgi:hypothetical protein
MEELGKMKVVILEYPPTVSWKTIETTLSKLGVTMQFVKWIPTGYKAEVLILPVPPKEGERHD